MVFISPASLFGIFQRLIQIFSKQRKSQKNVFMVLQFGQTLHNEEVIGIKIYLLII